MDQLLAEKRKEGRGVCQSTHMAIDDRHLRARATQLHRSTSTTTPLSTSTPEALLPEFVAGPRHCMPILLTAYIPTRTHSQVCCCPEQDSEPQRHHRSVGEPSSSWLIDARQPSPCSTLADRHIVTTFQISGLRRSSCHGAATPPHDDPPNVSQALRQNLPRPPV